MNNAEFLELFREQFDETSPNDIDLETSFKELPEWSSMVALTVIAMVDDKYKVKLTGDDIRNATTVDDLFNVVKGKVKASL
jgi:acyl carrier protein